MLRARSIYLGLLALTVALGLGSRAVHSGLYVLDKSAGDALYAVAVYWALRILWPHQSVPRAAALAAGICLAIETFKFTGLPEAWRASALSRVILGTTPSWHNLLCYGLAVGLVAGLEALVRRCR